MSKYKLAFCFLVFLQIGLLQAFPEETNEATPLIDNTNWENLDKDVPSYLVKHAYVLKDKNPVELNGKKRDHLTGLKGHNGQKVQSKFSLSQLSLYNPVKMTWLIMGSRKKRCMFNVLYSDGPISNL